MFMEARIKGKGKGRRWMDGWIEGTKKRNKTTTTHRTRKENNYKTRKENKKTRKPFSYHTLSCVSFSSICCFFYLAMGSWLVFLLPFSFSYLHVLLPLLSFPSFIFTAPAKKNKHFTQIEFTNMHASMQKPHQKTNSRSRTQPEGDTRTTMRAYRCHCRCHISYTITHSTTHKAFALFIG